MFLSSKYLDTGPRAKGHICFKVSTELVSQIDSRNIERFVATPVTVAGKVRGRGLLGNVTLDECNLVLNVGIDGPSGAVSEEPAPAETSHEQFDEPALGPSETT